jgi:hypothetical protein
MAAVTVVTATQQHGHCSRYFPARGIMQENKAIIDSSETAATTQQARSGKSLQNSSKESRRAGCARTVRERSVFSALGLALSEKQIPRFVENVSS